MRWLALLLLWMWAPTAWPEAARLSLQASAAQPQFTLYGTEDGLPSNQLRALLQDAQGVLWIASFGGLASFDGRRFESWTAPDDPRPLVAEALLETRDGQLWIAAEKRGLYRLDRSRQRWTRYGSTAPLARRLVTDDVWTLLEAADGGIWLAGYGGGLQRIDASGRALPPEEAWLNLISHEAITALGQGSASGLWIGTTDALWFWPQGAASAQRCGLLGNAGTNTIRSSAAVWVSTTDGRVYRFGRDCDEAELIYRGAEPAQYAQNVLLEDGELRAIGLRQGLAWLEVEADGARLRWLRPRFGVRGALPAAPVLSLHKDSEGGRWLALFGGGLAYLPPLAHALRVLPHDPVTPGGLTGRSFDGVVEAPDGALWLGSRDAGLIRLDPVSQQFQPWQPPARLQGMRPGVLALARMEKQLWVGGRDGLWQGRWTDAELIVERRLDQLVGVHALLAGRDGIWAAARADALYLLDPQGEIRERFAPGALAGDEVNQLLESPVGDLWLASDGGLQRYDRERRRFGFDLPVNRGDVASFCFHRQRLWVYVDAGLEVWDEAGQRRLARYGPRHGVPALDGLQLLCREDGVWLLSRSAISRFEPGMEATTVADAVRPNVPVSASRSVPHLPVSASRSVPHVRTWFERGDGLPGIELGIRMFGARSGGFDWVGGEGGMLGLPTNLTTPRTQSFPVQWLQAEVQRGERWVELSGERLELGPEDRNLRIRSRAVQFWRADATRFRYSLRSDGTRQQFESTADLLELPQLPPGRHELTLLAHNPRLGAAAQALRLEIRVHPPWWLTTPARLAALSLLVALVGLWVARSRRELRRRHARQLEQERLGFAESVAEAKSRFLAQTSHEMRNLLGGASGVAELIEAQSEQPAVRRKASRLVELCAELMRLLDDLLENARLERRQIQIQQLPLTAADCLQDIVSEHRERALRKGLALSIEQLGSARQRLGDPLRLKQIVGNLLSNAVKYTEQGSITLQLDETDPQQLSLAVTDTGPGLEPETRERLFEAFALGKHRRDSTGLGLSICRQLVDLAGGEIKVDSDAAGTCFRIRLPWPVAEAEPALRPQWLLLAVGHQVERWCHAADALGLELQVFDSLLALLAEPARLQQPGLNGILWPGAADTDVELAKLLLGSASVRVRAVPAETEPSTFFKAQLVAQSR